jgi:hypothetical protein
MANTEYENPTGDQPEPNAGEETEFEAPSSAAMAAEAEQAEAAAFLSQVDSQVLSAKEEIEKLLCSLTASDGVQSQAMMDSNIVGVGIGTGNGPSEFSSGAPGEPALEIYTIEQESVEKVKSRLASSVGVSALSGGDFPVTVVTTGIIDAYQHRMRLRPAPGGISVGHFAITAGTLGCLVRGIAPPRSNRLMVLSNNHVLANSNSARIGDCICQPGPYDGGRCPADQIAILESFVPIRFGGQDNFVDCATAWAWPDRVRRELMYLSGGAAQYFRVGSVPVAAVPNLVVGKSGRTTQLTRGTVTAVGVTINVSYGAAGVARFRDQIAIRAPSGDFSAGGDSGSLIWTWDARRAPVGLLFAGGGGMTFANRIGRVLTDLGVTISA